MADTIRETTQRFAADKIAPIAAEIDETDEFPRHLWRPMGELGLHGITVEEEYGGLGLGYLEHVVAQEEVARASASVGLSYGAHSNLCVNQVRRWANDEQKRKYLPKLISGEHVGALAMSEAGAGSDVVGMKLKAEKSGNGYRLNGTKFWITNGSGADTLVVYAKTGEGQPRHHRLHHRKGHGRLLDRPEGRQARACAARRPPSWCSTIASFRPRTFSARRTSGVEVLMSGLDYERTVLAGIQIGIMQACLDIVLPYVRERKQFGKPIGSFQLMQAKIADMYVALNSARAYVYQVAKACDAGKTTRYDAAGAILLASRECGEGRQRRGAGAGRRRLHQGLAGRTLLPRRQAARHRRRHQRDPPHADRAGADRRLSAKGGMPLRVLCGSGGPATRATSQQQAKPARPSFLTARDYQPIAAKIAHGRGLPDPGCTGCHGASLHGTNFGDNPATAALCCSEHHLLIARYATAHLERCSATACPVTAANSRSCRSKATNSSVMPTSPRSSPICGRSTGGNSAGLSPSTPAFAEGRRNAVASRPERRYRASLAGSDAR